MNIVFFGTPEFAAVCLSDIIKSHHKVVAIVTGEDKQRGRGQKLSPTPVKEIGLRSEINIIQPKNLDNDDLIEELKSLNADVFVVVAFKILPESIFTIPPKGTINLHGSLLPKYRGAAPIQWALIKGEKETGLTTFFIQKKVDTGNIILQKKINIDDNDNFGTLHDKMATEGGKLLIETLDKIELGNFNLIKQDDSQVSFAPKITNEMCQLDFNQTSEKIHNLVRGLSPYPGAFFRIKDKIYKVYRTRIWESQKIENYSDTIKIDSPQKINLIVTKRNIYVETSDGFIEILEIQPEGRKRMSTEDFLRGYKF